MRLNKVQDMAILNFNALEDTMRVHHALNFIMLMAILNTYCDKERSL